MRLDQVLSQVLNHTPELSILRKHAGTRSPLLQQL